VKPRPTVLEVDEAASNLGLSRTHFYRLLARFRQRPRSSTLLLKAEGRKSGSRFISHQVEEIIETARICRDKEVETVLLQKPGEAKECHEVG
jgi:predicted DNA-binding transcriptional regulator AlpA